MQLPWQRPFSAKLLLFGEYALLHGSAALALPLPQYQSFWVDNQRLNSEARASAQHLQRLFEFCRQQNLALDYPRFEAEAQRVYLASNLPKGYGLGSSGTVCAAVLARYGLAIPQDLNDLRLFLAQMEALWHGQSSGLDPLVSFLNQAVYRGRGGAWSAAELKVQQSFCHVYLVDSQIQRRTTDLVRHFKTDIFPRPDFQTGALPRLLSLNEVLVNLWLGLGDFEACFEYLAELSALQWQYFGAMIPRVQADLWQAGLGGAAPFRLKLCGAGGGGYALALARPDFVPPKDWILVV